MARDREKPPAGSSASSAAPAPKNGPSGAVAARQAAGTPGASHAIAAKLEGPAPASKPVEAAKAADAGQSVRSAAADKTAPSGARPGDRPATASAPPPAASPAGKAQAEGGQGGFWPGLLGGLIGGAATALAASFFWIVGPDGIAGLRSATDALGGRLSQAEQQIDRIGALDGRVAAIEAGSGSGEADDQAAERLAAFAQELQVLAAEVRATAAAQRSAAAAVADVQTSAADAGQRIETTGQALDTLAAETRTLAGSAEQLRGDLQALTMRVGTAEGRLDHLGGAYQRGAAMIVAIADVDRAIARSEPYGSALAALRSLAKDDTALDATLAALEPTAADGVPSFQALQSSFGAAASRALLADEGDRSLGDLVGDNLFGIINMRPAGAEAAGSDSRAVLARAHARLAEDDLEAALAELASLEGGAAQAMQPWVARAASRRAAEAAVLQLGAHAQSLVAAGR
jgi:hypothetical protein